MVMAKLKKTLTHLRKGESGQGALAIVVILLMLGAIILTPLLVFMSTGIKAGGVYESKVQEFYAADAGVADGLWQIKNDKLSTLFASYPYDPYNYNTNYSYPVAPSTLGYEINNENVTVNITNVWIPYGISCPTPEEARSIIESGTLIVMGKVITFSGGERGYEIKISYSYQSDDPNGEKLYVDKIGVWLSGGFHYVPGGLGNLSSYDSSPDVNAHCGGEAIVWDVNQAFKLSGQTGNPLVRTFNFQFTGPADQNPQAVSWIETNGVGDLSLSWDADSKPYRISSTAGSTTAEAYVVKNELRKLGGAISGDYVAIGGTLMTPKSTDSSNDQTYYRGQLLMGSSCTLALGNGVGQIPKDATVEAAYLYWSGWIDYHYWYKSWWWWYWGSIPELDYDNYASNVSQLIANAKVNTVNFGGGGNLTDITAHQWQVKENEDKPGTWSYSCFYDATDLVKQLINNGNLGPNGAGIYTLGHAASVVNQLRSGYPGTPPTYLPSPAYSFPLYGSSYYTGYPLGTPATTCGGSRLSTGEWAYAGWSLIIIYSSPETKGHQLYLYDDFVYSGMNQEAPLPNGNTISGFLAPPDITSGGQYAAHMTCFVGEGDEVYYGDFLAFNAPSQYWSNPGSIPNTYKLWDGITLPPSEHNSASDPNNVWNSRSVGINASGIDIDTFTISYPTIQPWDTSARIDLYTQSDSWNLIYIILSFRSDITTGGTISYLIRG